MACPQSKFDNYYDTIKTIVFWTNIFFVLWAVSHITVRRIIEMFCKKTLDIKYLLDDTMIVRLKKLNRVQPINIPEQLVEITREPYYDWLAKVVDFLMDIATKPQSLNNDISSNLPLIKSRQKDLRLFRNLNTTVSDKSLRKSKTVFCANCASQL